MCLEDSEAYWISPAGQILPVRQTHVKEVLDKPEVFEYSKDELIALYKKFNEPIGFEGKARHQIMETIIGRGWIRLRFNPRNSFWIIELSQMGKKEKEYLYTWASERINSFPKSRYEDVKIVELKTNNETTMFLEEMAGSALNVG